MTTDARELMTLEWFKPADLVLEDNIRHDDTVDPDLLASVQENGWQTPISVIRRSGTDYVRTGQRRWRVALELGIEIPAIVYPDDRSAEAIDAAAAKDAIDRICQQWAENLHEPLSLADKVQAVAALFEHGAKETKIRARTRLSAKEVRGAKAIAASEVATAAVAEHQLGFDDALAIAEFGDSPQRLKNLLATAGTAQFKRIAESYRIEDEARTNLAGILAGYTDAGYQVHEKGDDTPPWRHRLDNLYDPAGEPTHVQSAADVGSALEAESFGWHKDCPGRTVLVYWKYGYYSKGEPAYVVHYCADPGAYGHGMHEPVAAEGEAAASAAEAADAKQAREKAQAAAVRAGNKEWRAATKVRRAWLADLVAGSTPPPGALRFILDELVLGSSALERGMQNAWKLGRELAGLPAREDGSYHHDSKAQLVAAMAAASDKRAQVIAVALICGAYEFAIEDPHTWQSYAPQSETGRTWRTGYSNRADEQRYLRQCQAWGHDLGAIELLCIPGETAAEGTEPEGGPTADQVAEAALAETAGDDALD
jgi:ParB family transcriptional regulator, chromosome partitioning protein